MSIFPTTILLATDGSEEAQLAATTAADLAEKTNSELHLITHSTSCPSTPPTSKTCYGKTDARPRRCSSSRPRG
jgi:nucleotide-binding universal stress UspA family protein